MREVGSELSALYQQSKDELRRLHDEDLKQLNELAEELGTGYLTTGTP
jgi:hypothetical protein